MTTTIDVDVMYEQANGCLHVCIYVHINVWANSYEHEYMSMQVSKCMHACAYDSPSHIFISKALRETKGGR